MNNALHRRLQKLEAALKPQEETYEQFLDRFEREAVISEDGLRKLKLPDEASAVAKFGSKTLALQMINTIIWHESQPYEETGLPSWAETVAEMERRFNAVA